MKEYVILLKKVLGSLDEKHDSWIPESSETNEHWLILGHVDEIYRYSLSGENHFLQRQDDEQEEIHAKNSENVFYRPIFSFLEPKYLNPPTTNNWYVAFVRIHFTESININSQFDILAKNIFEASKQNNISVRIYRPTEFSDMLVELQGNTLSKLVKEALSIKNQDAVGKSYTYFGVSAMRLKQEELPNDKNDKLDFFSLRFSSPAFPSQQEEIIQLRNYIQTMFDMKNLSNKYCVTGVDDILIRANNVSARDIVEVVKLWQDYCRKGKPTIRTTTRVGYKIRNLSSNTSSRLTEPICVQLTQERGKFKEYCGRNSVPIPNGLTTASELVNAVVRMSRTPTMDEIVYLVAPGLCSFYQNLTLRLSENNLPETNDNNEKYKKFIESCAGLMEQLLRSEDQLSVQSEIRPAIYDIPVFMLEYTLAFLQKVSSWLITLDDWHQAEFTFLPIPCLSDQVHTNRIFLTSENAPGLVQMEFPVRYLYHPEQLLPALTHEISHHIGVRFRQREKRWTYFCKAAAFAFARSIFRAIDEPIVNFINEKIQNYTARLKSATLKELRDHVEIWVEKTFCFKESSHEYEIQLIQFIRDFRSYLVKENRIYYKVLWRNHMDFNLYIDLFYEMLEEIHHLFSEVYADTCMLHSLGFCSKNHPTQSEKDYICHFLKAAAEHPQRAVIPYTIRIYACLSALGINLMDVCDYNFDDNSPEQQDQWERIHHEICTILNDIENGEDSGNLQYPIEVIKQIAFYAEYCYNEMLQSNDGDAILKEIREMFRSCFDSAEKFYPGAFEAIDEWRKNILSRDARISANSAYVQ